MLQKPEWMLFQQQPDGLRAELSMSTTWQPGVTRQARSATHPETSLLLLSVLSSSAHLASRQAEYVTDGAGRGKEGPEDRGDVIN